MGGSQRTLQRRATLPGSLGVISTELDASLQVVSTRMPVSATIRSTIVAKMAIAARPKPDEVVAGSAAAGVEVSADTVEVQEVR